MLKEDEDGVELILVGDEEEDGKKEGDDQLSQRTRSTWLGVRDESKTLTKIRFDFG